jgi:putative transposase
VCIEDLQVNNMSRSAAGNLESPGTNVRAKSGLIAQTVRAIGA